MYLKITRRNCFSHYLAQSNLFLLFFNFRHFTYHGSFKVYLWRSGYYNLKRKSPGDQTLFYILKSSKGFEPVPEGAKQEQLNTAKKLISSETNFKEMKPEISKTPKFQENSNFTYLVRLLQTKKQKSESVGVKNLILKRLLIYWQLEICSNQM